MTIQQKQCLLRFLGFYDGAVDGLWGPRSQAAADAFCQAESCTSEELETALQAAVARWQADAWTGIRHFTRQEFACKCGGLCDGFPAEMDARLLEVADRVRERLGVPCRVSSGLRCRQHNANVGGVANSRHLTGKAMDFCAAGKGAQEVLTMVLAQPEVRYAYAIDGSYVHMDVE